MPLGRAGTALRLRLRRAHGTLTFMDTDSACDLDVRRIHAPGTSPEGSAAVITADLYVPGRQPVVGHRQAGRGSRRLKSSDNLGFRGKIALPPAQAKDLPPWIAAEPIGQLDRWASPAVSQSLSTERPARLGLLEPMTRPQKDVRWLSLRCLAYVGYFHNLVAAMNDSAHKLVWEEYIDELHAAVARDSDTAAAVRLELESQYPQQAAMLYRMLWGYTDDDLANGKDANLVRASTTTCWPCACWPSGTSRILPAWPVSITGPKTRRLAASSPSGVGKSGCGRHEIRVRSADERLARRPATLGAARCVARPPDRPAGQCARLIDAARCPMKRADRTPHRVECGRYRGSNHRARYGAAFRPPPEARAPVNACDGVSSTSIAAAAILSSLPGKNNRFTASDA